MAHPARPEPTSADATVIGLVLLVVGCGWLAQSAGVITITWPVLLSAALVALGVSLVVTARRSTSGLVLVAGVVMTAVLAATTSTINLDAGVLRSGAGDRIYRPVSVNALDTEFATAAGQLTIDLGDLDLDALRPGGQARTVRARIGFGELRVIVPNDIAIRLSAEVGVGEIEVFGETYAEGFHAERAYEDDDYDDPGAKRIDLDLSVMVGHVEVVRAA